MGMTAKMPVATLEEQLRTLEDMQRATLNILEDFDSEKTRLEGVQRATLNILDDFQTEKAHLEESQRAFLNILDDIDVEKEKVAAGSQQVEAANKELEAFTYSVAHDLRAPLRRIDGFAQLLMEDCSSGLGEEAQQYLRRVQEGTRQMGQLVDDLLNLAQRVRKEVRLQVPGLGSLVQAVVVDLKREAE